MTARMCPSPRLNKGTLAKMDTLSFKRIINICILGVSSLYTKLASLKGQVTQNYEKNKTKNKNETFSLLPLNVILFIHLFFRGNIHKLTFIWCKYVRFSTAVPPCVICSKVFTVDKPLGKSIVLGRFLILDCRGDRLGFDTSIFSRRCRYLIYW